MHHPSARQAPTMLLVLGLVLVVAALVATGMAGGSGGADITSAGETPSGVATPSDAATDATAPVPAPSATPTGPPGLDIKQQGKRQCVDAAVDTEITVVSFNIKSGRGGESLPAIATTLRDSGADVVLLQEVDRLRAASNRIDMPAYLGSQLEMFYEFATNVAHTPTAGYGTAMLSRFPIITIQNTFLPRPPGTQQRGLQHAVIDVEGTEVSIYNTHLQNASEAARMLQVAAINNLVAEDPRPRILGGDMNAPPGSPPMSVLTTSWTDTWLSVGSGSGRTAPAGAPRARIDYLLHHGETITPLASDVLPAQVSDHRAVRAAYRLSSQQAPICFQKLS